MSTHYVGGPGLLPEHVDRVVLGKWDGEDGGYIGEARKNGGIYYDTGGEAWSNLTQGLSPKQADSLAWQVNEQFLRTQLENRVPRIDYVVPDGFTSVDEVARVRRESFSAMEINYLDDQASHFGYTRVGNSWVYGGVQ